MPMTPQERQLVDELFDKLASLENAPRDPDAAKAIADGQRRAPNAVYALVQTVLLQDEALKRADERIQQLESGQQQQPQGGFLDNMRDTLFGGGSRGSVPSVRPGDANARGPENRGPMWNSGQVLGSQGAGNGGGYGYGNGAPPAPGPAAPAGGGGGSFLGTAAAAAAGVIGGSLLMNSMRGMFGGSGQQHGFGDQTGLGGDKGNAGSGNPWGGSNSGGDLARDAGLNDIGKSNAGGSDNYSRQGLFDQASNDSGHDSDDDDDDFDSDDFDGGGDSDYA